MLAVVRGVALIFCGMRERAAPGGIWRRWGRLHVLIAPGPAPLLLILFQRVSLVFLLANLVAVPWITFVVVPLTLRGTWTVLPLSALGSVPLQMADGAMG